MQARIGEPDPATGKAKAYAVKLAHVLRNCASPTLLIYRLPDETNPGCDAAQNPVPGGGVCDSSPPLDIEDPDKPGFSYPVRLRVYVSSNLEGEPIVQGQAYWTDPASGLAVTCSSPAEERVFVDDPGNMASVRGKWGAVVHERRYRLDLTRAGDSAASGQ